jgi:ribulose-5-phosphate 4-epimerase/fuculose-1-phosphate aldolase
MILRNHGLLVCGRTIPEAFYLIYMLERACQAQLAAMTGGAELIVPPEEVRQRTAAQYDRLDALEHYEMVWQASLRLIEGQGTDWRT